MDPLSVIHNDTMPSMSSYEQEKQVDPKVVTEYCDSYHRLPLGFHNTDNIPPSHSQLFGTVSPSEMLSECVFYVSSECVTTTLYQLAGFVSISIAAQSAPEFDANLFDVRTSIHQLMK